MCHLELLVPGGQREGGATSSQVGFADCVGKVPGTQSVLERADCGKGAVRGAAWSFRAAQPCWGHASEDNSGVVWALHPPAMSC